MRILKFCSLFVLIACMFCITACGDKDVQVDNKKIRRATIDFEISDEIRAWASGEEICVLEAGKTLKDIVLSVSDEKAFEAEIVSVELLNDFDYPEKTLSDTDVFELGKKYNITLRVKEKNGYKFAAHTVFSVARKNMDPTDDKQFSFTSVAADSRYKKEDIKLHRGDNRTPFNGAEIYMFLPDRTMVNCKRFTYRYNCRKSLNPNENVGGVYDNRQIHWDLYVREVGGQFIKVHTFETVFYGSDTDTVELERPMNIDIMFVVPRVS
ncbi:MAG: hypothetical protein IKJ55_05105, partial [Clostridia bacterium]|nr:hypothetical protein [Clostridia bacterium]